MPRILTIIDGWKTHFAAAAYLVLTVFLWHHGTLPTRDAWLGIGGALGFGAVKVGQQKNLAKIVETTEQAKNCP